MTDQTSEQPPGQVRRGRGRRLLFLLPLLLFLIIAVFLGIGLTLNPRELPSPLIDKQIPEFALPAVQGRDLGLASADLHGAVSLVNVFASWCVACREEHSLLLRLKRQALAPIHGLNYKDKPADAATWLDRLGDPYTRTGADLDGRVGIEWGVYGVPETFVIDRSGRIAHKHIGPITMNDWTRTILPLVERLRRRDTGAAPFNAPSSAALVSRQRR